MDKIITVLGYKNFITEMSDAPDCCPSVRLSVRLSTFWLTSAFKFVLGLINQYRLDTLQGNRPW